MNTAGRQQRARVQSREPMHGARPRSGALHLDLVAGGLLEILHRVANPVRNTLADSSVYGGRPQRELFPAPGRVPEVAVTARWRLPGIVSEDLVFRSLHVPIEPRFRERYRSEYEATHLVYARRIRPVSASRRPRLLYLHGYMQPETYLEELALLTSMALALNVEIIQMQFPYHGRRTPRAARYSGELYWTADLVRSFEALRQTLLDARTLLHWLLAQDRRPVGVTGLSLGGALTLSLACLEPRFAFAMPLIAHMDLAALVADAPVLSKMRRDLRAFGWERADLNSFVEGIGWNQLRPKLPADKVFVVAASEDRFFDPRIVEQTWSRWGKPAIQWYATSHIGFLPRLPTVWRPMRQLVDRIAAADDRSEPVSRRRGQRNSAGQGVVELKQKGTVENAVGLARGSGTTDACSAPTSGQRKDRRIQ